DKPKKAAYQLFRVLELERLTTDECREVWAQLTGEQRDERGIRPVEIFTGGNLGMVASLAQFAGPAHDFTHALLSWLDDHGDDVDASVGALPLDERRAFLALCERWAPALAR